MIKPSPIEIPEKAAKIIPRTPQTPDLIGVPAEIDAKNGKIEAEVAGMTGVDAEETVGVVAEAVGAVILIEITRMLKTTVIIVKANPLPGCPSLTSWRGRYPGVVRDPKRPRIRIRNGPQIIILPLPDRKRAHGIIGVDPEMRLKRGGRV